MMLNIFLLEVVTAVRSSLWAEPVQVISITEPVGACAGALSVALIGVASMGRFASIAVFAPEIIGIRCYVGTGADP